MRPASQEEIALFALMGQALLNIQVLEECLSVSITLKVDVGYPRKISKAEAECILKERKKFTLGDAIKEAQEKKLYPDTLQKDLGSFRHERNWLAHRCIDEFYMPERRKLFVERLKHVASASYRLQRMIENDLIEFSEANGGDMSAVRAAIEKYSHI